MKLDDRDNGCHTRVGRFDSLSPKNGRSLSSGSLPLAHTHCHLLKSGPCHVRSNAPTRCHAARFSKVSYLGDMMVQVQLAIF
jgi:hypothetical protein